MVSGIRVIGGCNSIKTAVLLGFWPVRGMAETLPAAAVDLAGLGARAAEFARTSRSATTERAYRSR
jgi:hypothetical protein